MELMRDTPDGYYDLAITDPPYGIGRSGKPESTSSHGGHKGFADKGWDYARPSSLYFSELRRVSKNQIVWGANYYPERFSASPGWILWDKGQRIDQADGELAFSSFNKPLRVFTLNRVALMIEGTIHPTQKPIKLYAWLLENYAKPGQRILDTHLGSGSHAIAAHYFGAHLTACEIDADYYAAACERIKRETAQEMLPMAAAEPEHVTADMFGPE
jgi:site-specific DNA-methyltransferase (adenine-specific)